MSASLQNEFPLRIPICAWCKPKNRGLELGTGIGVISHGICPRHLKKLRLELQKDSAHAVPALAGHSRRRGMVSDHPELIHQA